MGLIRNIKRKMAIKSYVNKLPALLVKDYGKSKKYTPQQVKLTIERGGLSVADACFGIAMFSSKHDFNQYHEEIGESCDYDSMRCEIGLSHFNGHSDFSVADISSVSSNFGGSIDAGGFSGGDGGGGD